MSSSDNSPEIIKKKHVLYVYLVALSEHIVPGDFYSEPQNNNQASSSKEPTQTQTNPTDMSIPDM
jgi:hypothetical protein